jgi:uncharacterized membrane protein (UPF0127 family)
VVCSLLSTVLPQDGSCPLFSGKTMTISFNFRRRAKPNVHLRIWNVTRGTELGASVELANHSAARRKGLLGRDSLFAGEGLWILPCQAVHTVGMRFPIDLVYLDRDLRVRKVRSNVYPWRLSACVSAHSVLELAPGTIQETQTNRGDQLKISSPVAPAGS